MTNHLEDEVRKDPCQHIIHDDSPSSLHPPLEERDGEGFEDVEEPKGNETDKRVFPAEGNEAHRDKVTSDLIDHDLLGIGLLKNGLRQPSRPDGEKDKCKGENKEMQGRKSVDRPVEEEAHRGPVSAFWAGEKTHTGAGCKEEDDFSHDHSIHFPNRFQRIPPWS